MIPNEENTSDGLDDCNVEGKRTKVDYYKKKKEEEEKEEDEEEPDETLKLKTEKQRVINDRLYLDGCVYRGEGNANVVIALPRERKVLRFRKSSVNCEALPDGGRARTTREIEFLKYVISGLLGSYVEPPESIRLTHEEMIKVSEAIRHLRPEHRRFKKIVEDYATVFEDYAFIPKNITALLRNYSTRPTFCVEIKPKQGFRHEFDEQFKKCTYCLTQYYKLTNGAIKSRSNYCPYDLFSGDNERMIKSLRSLIESPQNNLKIFKNGHVVYDCNSDTHDLERVLNEWFNNRVYRNVEKYDKFYQIVINSLLREFSMSKNYERRKETRAVLSPSEFQTQPRIDRDIVSRAKRILCFDHRECNFARNYDIPQGSVLGKILDMQRLPYHSSDLVYSVYTEHFGFLNDDMIYSQIIRNHRGENEASDCEEKKKANRDFLVSPRAANSSSNIVKSRHRISDSNGNEDHKSTDSVLRPVASKATLDYRNNNNSGKTRSREEIESAMTIGELEILQNYLLVTTARDCSILIAFQEVDSANAADIPAEFILRETEGVNFLVNIGVLDLDPKSIHCIEKHRERDISVLLAVTKVLEEELDFGNKLPYDPA